MDCWSTFDDVASAFLRECGGSLTFISHHRVKPVSACALLRRLLLFLKFLLEFVGHLDHLEVLHEVLRPVQALDWSAKPGQNNK